jgi:hypothetical protein
MDTDFNRKERKERKAEATPFTRPLAFSLQPSFLPVDSAQSARNYSPVSRI